MPSSRQVERILSSMPREISEYSICRSPIGWTAAVRRMSRRRLDLIEHACIRHCFVSGASSPWEFEGKGKVAKINPTGPLIASTTDLEVSAAVAGLGVICTFEEFVAPALKSGELVPVLDE